MLKSMLVFSAPFIMRGMRRGGWLLVVLLLFCVCACVCACVCMRVGYHTANGVHVDCLDCFPAISVAHW